MNANATATRALGRLPLAVAIAALPLLAGCNGALIGNVFVLAVTLGIFFGTLGLGRSTSRTATQSGTESQATAPRAPRA